MTGGMICSDAFLSFSVFYFSVFYESYVGWDKQLYNHNNDDGGTEECSAPPSAWAEHRAVPLDSWQAICLT